ncbi:MAG: hypothetical protein ACR2G6_10850 [Gemmatimonadaceae bacterium]
MSITGKGEFGAITNRISGLLSFRPDPRWQLSLQPNYLIFQDAQQYVTTLSGGRPETYDRRYVFAYIDRSTLFTDIRLNYTLKPDITLELYAQPFAASGRYSDFGELSAPQRRASQEVRRGQHDDPAAERQELHRDGFKGH